jgi:hypothetical protein
MQMLVENQEFQISFLVIIEVDPELKKKKKKNHHVRKREMDAKQFSTSINIIIANFVGSGERGEGECK